MKSLRYGIGLLILLAGCGGSAPVITTIGAEPTDGRLPSDLTPLSYSLSLDIFPERERFEGVTEIRVRLDEPRNLIWMHGVDLEVTEAIVTSESGVTVGGEWRSGSGDDDFASLRVPEPLAAGEYTLRLSYSAPYNDELESLYAVQVGEDHYAYTQMEPLSARRAFPCFDEPRFKTPFDVQLTVASDNVAITNAPATGEEVGEDGTKTVTFATSRLMPTYLVAFAVGPFDVVEMEGGIPANEIREEPLPFRGIAVRGRGAEMAYAMEQTPEILAITERYMGSGYPYAKLDIIAVPDFGAGAMENPGAVTFRDTLLLFDGEEAPISTRRWFAFIMAHELAHMWFGNLVTMEWWDDLWLNEAMATWMESRIIAEWDEAYDAEIALSEWAARAMKADSLPNARSIRNPIRSSHDIHAAFDSITYSKGGAVLRMFEQWLGAERLQAGIHRYLEAHAWGTATDADFIAAIGAEVEEDVTQPFRTFLTQPGVPFLQTELVCDSEGVRVNIRQSRYVPTGSSGTAEATWAVPVCIRYPTNRGSDVACSVIDSAESSISIETRACPGWILPNANGSGYFRYSISEQHLSEIFRKGLRELSVQERLSLVNNIVAGFENGTMPANVALPALLRFGRDRHYAVASAPMELFRRLESRLLSGDAVGQLRSQLQSTYGPALRRVRWDARRRDSFGDEILRGRLIPFLALVARDRATRREAQRRGDRWFAAEAAGRSQHEAVSTFLTVAVQDGGAEVFDAALQLLGSLEDGNERRPLLMALGRVQDSELAMRARGLTTDESLRINERLRPLMMQFRSGDTRDESWFWLMEHYDSLAASLSAGQLARLPNVASTFCDAASAEQIQEFFAERVGDLPSGSRTLESAILSVRICAALREAQADSLAEWSGS